MKSTFFYLFAVLFACATLITSCSDDPVGGGVIGPGTNSFTSASEIDALGSFDINVTATSGDNPLNTLTIQKDGVSIPFSSITINSTAASANPALLFGSDKNSFDYDITIQTDLATGESANYTFIITDEVGQTSTESAFISVSDVVVPPTLTRDGGNDPIPVAPGTQFTHMLTAVAGSSDLVSLEIQEDGVSVDASRIDVAGQTMLTNPIAISTADAQGFTDWMVDVRASQAPSAIYTFLLTDAAGETASVTREVTTSTPLDSIKTLLQLFNQAGPSGTGGVNLITGESLGSDDAAAHLRDKGINSDLPAEQNWLQQIAPGNATTTLKAITTVQPEGFSYSAVDSKEAVEAAFNLETNVIDAGGSSNRIAPGDMFVLLTAAGKYMLVNIDALIINTADNSDYYEISAKF